MKSRSIKKQKIALMLSFLFLLTGCGEKYPEAPELLESVITNESYRPVEYKDVGTLELTYGNVVPTEYCHFWESQVTVGELKVNVGDYVEAGDVIAVADAASVEKEQIRLSRSLEQENAVFAVNEEIYAKNKQIMEYKLAGSRQLGDAEGENQANTSLAVMAEDHRYDTMLHQRRVERLKEDLAKQNDILADGTLRAQVSGYVTYVKDITETRVVGNTENLVVISDYNDCYVELKDVDVSKNIFEGFSSCYTNISGRKCALEEYAYSKNELLVAESKNRYPNTRLRFVEPQYMPEVGSSLPVFFQRDSKENVLVVGLDSCYQDSNGNFVYVMKDGKQEQRYVELGVQDSNYAEVVSGLEDGELVYYSSDSLLPEDYVEYVATSSDYIVENQSQSYEVKDTQSENYYSEDDGQLTKLYVSDRDTVQKGDLICTIKVNEGSARLTEMRNSIENFKESHRQMTESYKAQIEEIETQQSNAWAEKNQVTNTETANAETATETDATETDAAIPQDPYLYEELGLQAEILRLEQKKDEIQYNYQLVDMEEGYEEASRNNDGSGNINVYAEETGTISRLNLREGAKVTYGQRLFCIDVSAKTQLQLLTQSELLLGQEVTFTDQDSNQTYKGRITGFTGQNGGGRLYVTTKNDKVYLTENIGSGGYPRYYITLEDDSFFAQERKNVMITYPLRVIRNTVVLPDGVVNTFVGRASKEEIHFVWRVVDGNLVKQYVTITRDNVYGKTYTCAISGIKPGDVLAQEVHE